MNRIINIETGRRLLITKGKNDFISVGERGTIEDISHDNPYRIKLNVRFDDGKTLWIDNVNFTFEVY